MLQNIVSNNKIFFIDVYTVVVNIKKLFTRKETKIIELSKDQEEADDI